VSDEPRRRTAQTGYVIGRVVGVPVVVSPSWLVAGLLLCAVYGPVLRDAVPGISASTAYAAAFGFAALFGLCVLAHELGHTLVSIRLGHPVRRVVLFALGGVSEIENEPERARDELLIAASGPAVSLLIAAGAGWAYSATPGGTLATALLGLLFWSNLVLAIFNLLPGLPLDGGRLLRATVCAFGASPLIGTKVAAWSGRFIAVALLASAFLLDRTSAGVLSGVFTAAIAVYLWVAAGRSVTIAEVATRLPGVTVNSLLRPGMFIRADASVAEALDRAWHARARGLVLVDAADRPTAIVDEALIGAVPPERRPWTAVSEVARPLEAGLTLPHDLAGDGLIERMRSTPAHEYLVLNPDGSAAGIITTRDLVQRLKGSA
jgi:Zn-dependent protease/CBS domain-containing protein